jgi:hypothetical protein
MNERPTFTIYNQRLAGYLMQRGFVLMGMKKSFTSHRNVFFFRKTDKLLETMKTYQSK